MGKYIDLLRKLRYIFKIINCAGICTIYTVYTARSASRSKNVGAFLNIGEGGNFMQRKKRTKSKLVKQFMNFLLAIALGISLLQLPQLSKEVKAENVNTNNGKQSQEMAGSYYLDKNRNSGKKVIAANAGLTPEDNLGPYIKYTIQ